MHTNFGVKITITNKTVEELSKRGILLSPVKSMNKKPIDNCSYQ